MKLSELKINVPTIKPRNNTYQTLAAKKNAAGPHRDKKAELKKGLLKHKYKSMHEAIDVLAEEIPEDKLNDIANDLYSLKKSLRKKMLAADSDTITIKAATDCKRI